jgi:hypothetical protein
MQIIAVVLLLAVAVVGQTNKGGISGTVMDQNGAAIPGATVTVTNAGTGQKQTLTTSESGTFSVNSLDPVTYSITVEAQGFKTATVESLKVDTATIASANILLEPGAVGEQVTVVADATLLNTESGTTTSTVTERQIQDIPLNNRSVLDLAVTAPNVSGDVGSEDPGVSSDQPAPGFNLNVNGGRAGSTAILADGVNNTGVGIARSVVSFTPETVQEFTVQTSAYSAEFGNTAGGVINATTKSGTNEFNGIALLYHRNPATNARPWRQGTGPRPPNNLRYTQASFTLGGPIYLPSFGEGGPKLWSGKNKSFFFFAIEPRWRRDFLAQPTLLPTAAERAGDFSGVVRTASGWLPTDVAARFNAAAVGPNTIYQQFTRDASGRLVQLPQTCTTGSVTVATYCPFAGNRIPQSLINPTALKILEFMPAGGDYFLDEDGLVRNYVVNRFVQQDETRYTLRLDHSFTDAFKANFRYTSTPAIGIRGFGSDVNGNTAAYSNAKQMLLAFNNIISPSIVNDLRLNYTRGVFSEDFSPEFSVKGGRNLATELGLPSLTAGGIPLFQISSDTNGYNNFANVGSSGSTNNYNVEERYNINDIVYYSRGNMTWKFGVDLQHALLNVIPFFAASGGRWDFRVVQTSSNRGTALGSAGNPLASLLLGTPNRVDVRPLLVPYYYRWNAGAAFVQNDWKVRPNLTLNLGLRYSLQLPRTEKYNRQGSFRPDLARDFALTAAQRRTLATNLGVAATAPIPATIPTAISVPAFALSGYGGRSEYITAVDYLGFEPRFGFAWSPKLNWLSFLSDRSAVIRGGYGISHAAITGNNRLPNPDFGSFTSGAGRDATQPLSLSNPPVVSTQTFESALGGVPEDGLIYLKSLAIPAFADSGFGIGSGKVPYSQNWNLTLQFEPLRNTVVEFAYVGNKGTHLYMPLVNINPRNFDLVEALESANLNADANVADPLGRTDLVGSPITVQRGALTTQFIGFNNLYRYFDPSANSIRHAGYVDVRRRVRRGLTFTANYTYGKSIDDASDSSPDTRVLTTSSTQGHVTYGAPRNLDRSLSTFDIKHNFSSTFVWDVPVGRKQSLLKDAPAVVDSLLGGWTISGLFRMQGGTPFIPTLVDTNRLGGVNRVVRPDIVEGVPLLNPRYDPSCRVGTTCEPYINPAAFRRPAKGSLGNAPRTLDVRGPMQEYFDFAFQKNIPLPARWNADGKRRINLRVDLINAFNHPNFRLNSLNFTNLPDEAAIATADYDAWVAADPSRAGLARSTTAGAAAFAQVQSLVTANRLPSGGLPLNFFSSQNLPEGFATTTATQFDIRTLEGFKLYRLRRAYDNNFGTLRALDAPRYIQFGIRIFF